MNLTSMLGIALALTLFITVIVRALRNDALARMHDSELEAEDHWQCSTGRFKNRYARELARRQAVRLLAPAVSRIDTI